MAVFQYRVRAAAPIELAASPRAPAGPWLDLEATSFDEARRTLAELSAATGFVYECREPGEGE